MDPSTLIILLVAVIVLALLAQRLNVPYPAVMVVGGLAICFIPRLDHVTVDPKIIFTVFLPPLLYGAAWVTSWKDFTAYLRPISALAVVLVLVTIAGIAIVVKWLVPDLPWSAAFALGAIISPPDALAVTALTKRLPIPRETLLVLEGESLVNDATALVVLRVAMTAAVTGTFSLTHAAGDFALVAFGGIGAGLGVGWLVSAIHKRLNDPLIETTITILTPYTAYLLAEQIHLSGVLAVVTAGLYVSWQSPQLFGPRLRLQAMAVWDFFTFILNGLIFVLLGLQLPEVLAHLPQVSFFTLFMCVVCVITTAITIRFVCVVGGAYVPRFLSWRGPGQFTRFSDVVLIGLTGMRGVVSLAAAMALPVDPPFPRRNLMIFLAFSVILFTLVVQSLALPTIMRFLQIVVPEDEFEEEREARLAAARAGHAYITEITAATDAFGDTGPRLRAMYAQRIEDIEQGAGTLPLSQFGVALSPFEVHKAALDEERRVLLELRGARKISYEIFQRLMAEVDSDELKAEKHRMRQTKSAPKDASV